MPMRRNPMLPIAIAAAIAACTPMSSEPPAEAEYSEGDAAPAPVDPDRKEYYGTLEPMAEHAVYFVVTDRFVNGDEGNDQRDQGGEHPTFDIPLDCPGDDNIGYLGGDFRGLLDNATYIR
jgi:hypothetical protein